MNKVLRLSFRFRNTIRNFTEVSRMKEKKEIREISMNIKEIGGLQSSPTRF